MFPKILCIVKFLSWVVVEFCQMLFCIYWYDCVVFILCFVNVVYHIDWFVDIEPSLHPWNKSHLITVWSFLCVVEFGLVIFCWGFLHLYSLGILACNFLFCSVLVWFWYQGYGGLIESVWECSFLFNFWNSLRRISIISSLYVW